MRAEELEAEWLQRNIYPCGTYVAMAIQVEPVAPAPRCPDLKCYA